MQLAALLKHIDGATATAVPHVDVVGITADSRQVRPGYLFVAVKGTRQDGGDFIKDAVNRGAVAVLSDAEAGPGGGVPFIVAPDATRALAQAASTFYHHPSHKLGMVGITGTNGKTTTAYMIWDVMCRTGRNPGLLGTVEYRIGARVIPSELTTPAACDLQRMLHEMVTAGCGNAIMEVSSHSLQQRRVECIEFDVGVFTNLTHDHLDYHKSMEQYFEAKSLLFASLGERKKATAVMNLDDPWGAKLAEREWNAQVVRYGMTNGADVLATDVELSRIGSACRVHSPWGDAELHQKLLGRFNISNSLAALACCGALGIDIAEAAAVISEMSCVPGRLEEVVTGRDYQVFVDYAHTGDALQHVLTTLRELTRNRLIVVFGCGGDRDRRKRPAMGRVAGELADYSILTSDNPRSENPASILVEIEAGLPETAAYSVIEKRADAIEQAVQMAEPGDIVLIAGKGHEAFQQFADTTIAFDDREMVRRVLS